MINYLINLFLILFYYGQEEQFTYEIGKRRAKLMTDDEQELNDD